MTGSYLHRVCLCTFACFLVVICSLLVVAENVKIEGLIVGRSGDEIIVKFGSGAESCLSKQHELLGYKPDPLRHISVQRE